MTSVNLSLLTKEQRSQLAIELLQDIAYDYRKKLHRWRELTNQSSQIDTGYVAQHLVSILTGMKGTGMRGKGDDIEDGSEIKSANFWDSLDQRGAVAPRWNFTFNDLPSMESFLGLPAIYLVSLDSNPNNMMRARVWKLDPDIHITFRNRFLEWVERKGKPKLSDPARPGINFQLFPPRNLTDDNYARHGNDQRNGFRKVKLNLEGIDGSKIIFKAEVNKEELFELRLGDF